MMKPEINQPCQDLFIELTSRRYIINLTKLENARENNNKSGIMNIKNSLYQNTERDHIILRKVIR